MLKNLLHVYNSFAIFFFIWERERKREHDFLVIGEFEFLLFQITFLVEYGKCHDTNYMVCFILT